MATRTPMSEGFLVLDVRPLPVDASNRPPEDESLASQARAAAARWRAPETTPLPVTPRGVQPALSDEGAVRAAGFDPVAAAWRLAHVVGFGFGVGLAWAVLDALL